MSFFAEVMSNMEKVNLETITKVLPQTKNNVDKLKSEVLDYMQRVYEFSTRNTQESFMENCETLRSDLSSLRESVKTIKTAEIKPQSLEILQYADEIEDCHIKLLLVSNLIAMHEGIQKINQLQGEKLYVQAMEEMQKIINCTNNLPENEILDGVFELVRVVSSEKTKLLIKLNNIWSENVVIQESNKENEKVTIVKIKQKNDIFNQVLLALVITDKNAKDFLLLYNFAMTIYNIFKSIIENKCVLSIDSNEPYETLQITSIPGSKHQKYKVVFENICKVVSFITKHFNYEIENYDNTMKYIGQKISNDFVHDIITKCLSETIPSNEEGLSKYSDTNKDVENFLNYLKQTQLIEENDNRLLEYVTNVNTHYIVKKCNSYTQRAIVIMKKDLDNLVEVGEPRNSSTPLTEFMSEEFPHSSVSSSTIEFIKLAEEILQCAITSSDKKTTDKLFNTLQHILSIYGETVKTQHKKLLQTIPQQVAIYYNNCLYISHNIMKWNGQYQDKVSAHLKNEEVLFNNQQIILLAIANETFNTYVDFLVAQIEETLKELNLNHVKSLEKVDASTEKCVRQCLRQNELLKTVWQKVLPYDVYNKTIGIILNAICKCIINSVISIEDIFTEAAEQLVDVLKLVQTRGAKLFTDPNEICIFVEQWGRFKELMLILSSGLTDISERWAEGKGPLALHFKPEEVKGLVRALFQNNEKRDLVLSKLYL